MKGSKDKEEKGTDSNPYTHDKKLSLSKEPKPLILILKFQLVKFLQELVRLDGS